MRHYFDNLIYFTFGSIAIVAVIIILSKVLFAHKKTYIEFNCPQEAFMGEMVRFSDTARETKERQWIFGDGNQIQNLYYRTSHFYNREGTFKVALVIDGDSAFREIAIKSKVPPLRNVMPDIDCPSDAKVQVKIHFSDNTPGASNWEWDFGEGNLKSNEQNPTVAFKTPGTKNITLKVSGNGISGTSNCLVEVKRTNPPPHHHENQISNSDWQLLFNTTVLEKDDKKKFNSSIELSKYFFNKNILILVNSKEQTWEEFLEKAKKKQLIITKAKLEWSKDGMHITKINVTTNN